VGTDETSQGLELSLELGEALLAMWVVINVRLTVERPVLSLYYKVSFQDLRIFSFDLLGQIVRPHLILRPKFCYPLYVVDLWGSPVIDVATLFKI
jgi:hypothetical protein